LVVCQTASGTDVKMATMDPLDAVAVAAAEAVRRDEFPAERHERVLLRPWLENLIHSGLIPGLEWIDAGKTMFKVPWKHRSKKNWSLRHSSVFLVSFRLHHRLV